MDTSTNESRHISSLSTSLILILLFTGISLPVNSQTSNASNNVTCKLKINDQEYNLPANSAGNFQRISGVRTNATIPIEIFYPNGNAGDEVVLNILDGGNLDNGKTVSVVPLNKENKCVFNLQVNSQFGIFRVQATKGFDQNMVQVSVTAKDSTTSPRTAPPPSCPSCGNNQHEESNCPTTGINYFDAYTSNVSRNVNDLEIWGGTGKIPLVAKRFGNSRAVDGPWQLNFFYGLYDAGVNASGQPQIEIHFPHGWRTHFTKSTAMPNLWLPLPGVGMRLFQYGNIFFLQLANGHRYQFERVESAGVASYILREINDEFQNVYQVTYDLPNRKKRITEPAGRFFEYTFSPLSFIVDPIKIQTNDGRSARFIYDTINDRIRYHVRLRKVLYGDGTKALYDYSQTAPGRPFSLSHAVDPRVDGTATNMKYEYVNAPEVGLIYKEFNGKTDELMATLDASGNDKKVLYANGRMQVLNMPEGQEGKINTYTDGVGATNIYEYYDNGIGFTKSATDALGRKTSYDALTIYGNPLEITYPDGSKDKWTRDTLDQVLTHIDGLGRVTTYTRDDRHRPVKITYPDGTFETFTYNNFSQVLDHQKKNGCTEHFVYDSRALKTKFTDCAGNATTYNYDGADRMAMVTDARGNATKYEYNERGFMTKMINADNSIQTYTYDDFGNRVTLTNELGKTWKTAYDEFRRPVSATDPLNRTTTFSYDLAGGVCGCSHTENSPTKITLPSGRMTSYTYDVEWRKISETNGAGSTDAATTGYQYDLIGNLVKTVDGHSNQWPMTYDVRNRKKTAANPLGNTIQWTYDFAGNTKTVIRPDAGTTTYVYDNMNRLTQTTDPKAQVTKMTYDADGNMVKLTDPKNNDYKFEYDALDRKTKMIYPGGLFEQYTYDPVSNTKTYTNRNGDVRTYTYDNRNRETLSDWSDATPDVTTNYDLVSRVITKTSTVSQLSYTYNDANEMLSETQNVAGNTEKTVSYTYNTDGLRNTLVYPDATVITYGYTNRNQVATISQGAPLLAQYIYDANGNRVAKTLNNGTNTQYIYDDANRVLSLDNRKAAVSFAKFNYGYDNVNRRKYVQYDNLNGDVYSYDAIDQVTDVKYDVTNPDGVPGVPTRTVSYGLDPAGNRTTVTDNGLPTNYASNNLNQYTGVGVNPVTNSANGNIATFDGWTYTYDAQNRLTKALKGGTTVDFAYDPLNRCVKRTINAAVTFLYYENWNLLQELNFAGVLTERYVHGAMVDELIKKLSAGMDEILTKTVGGNTLYYHHDGLGNVMGLTNEIGMVVEQYRYDVYGTVTIKDAGGNAITASAFGNRFMFTGREYIKEIELYDFRNRMYSQKLGRFLQTDPIGFGANDVNIYRYVGNNSINLRDPMGLGFWSSFVEGVVTGIVTTAIVVATAVAVVAIIPAAAAVVTATLLVAGGVGVVTTVISIINDHSAENIGYQLGAVTGSLIVGGASGRILANRLSPPGNQPPAGISAWSLTRDRSQVWRSGGPDGTPSPFAMFRPGQFMSANATGPNPLSGAAAAAGLGSGTASIYDWIIDWITECE